MDILNDEFILKLIYESNDTKNIECKMNDKMENIFKNYAVQLGKKIDSLIFLYNGIKINDFQKSFFSIINDVDRKRKEMNVLVYTIEIKEPNICNIIFSLESEIVRKFQFNRNEKMKNICHKFAVENGCDFNSLIFKYEGKEIDFTKTIFEQSNLFDKKCNGMNISVYKKTPLEIEFVFGKDPTKENHYQEDKIYNICHEFAEKKGLKINQLSFQYDVNPFNNLNQNFKDYLNSIADNSKTHNRLGTDENTIETNVFDAENNIKKINKMKINVNNTSSKCSIKKKIIISSLIVLVVLIAVLLMIFIFYKNNRDTDIVVPDTDTVVPDTDTVAPDTDTVVPDTDTVAPDTDTVAPDTDTETPDTDTVTSDSDTFTSDTDIVVPDKDTVVPGKDTVVPDTSDTIKETNYISNTIILLPKKCNKGYFIPDDDQTFQDCKKCSLERCEKCNGTYISNECIICENNSKPIYNNNKIIKCEFICETGEEDKCLTCSNILNQYGSCNIGYLLEDGKCKVNYLIKAIYFSRTNRENVDLISKHLDSITQMIIDGKNITPVYSYNFPEKSDNHIVYLSFKYTKASNSINMFKNITRLREIYFTDFKINGYIPDISFQGMFRNCINLISVDLSKYSSSTLSSFNYTFSESISLKYVNFNFNKDLLSIKSAEYMFNKCISLTSIDLSKFNVTTALNLQNMFSHCISLKTINLTNFSPREANNINHIFYNCSSLESIDLSYFNISKAKDISYMFAYCSSLKTIDISKFTPSNLENIRNMFINCTSLSSINLNDFTTDRVTNMISLFYGCENLFSVDLSSFNTQNVKYFNYMFYNCYSIRSIDFSNFYTENLEQMKYMFYNCHSLTSINIKGINTEKVGDIQYMLYGCYSLQSIDLSSFNNNEKITTMNNLFSNCYSLKSVDLSAFNNNEKITSLGNMFENCISLTSVDFSNFKTDNIRNYSQLFYNCSKLSYIHISSFKCNYGYVSYNLFNGNISSNGTIIINNQCYNKIKNQISWTWTIIFK